MTGIPTETLMEYMAVEYRWVLVMLILLPMSAAWNLWSYCRNYVVFKMNSAPQKHHQKVQEVQRQVKEWLAGDRSTHMCTARPTWQAMSYRQGLYKKTFTNIKVDLVDILEIDTKNMTVRCEPLVNMGQLSRMLKPYGLTLPVVPELEQLTVGGMAMGTGLETSSHVHGIFQDLCLKYEMVLADGSVVTCSKDENPDLFYAVPWSVGTLGFLTSVVMKVVPAKKYVRLQYHPYYNLSDLAKRFKEESLRSDPPDFIETVMFNKDSGVIMLGDMVDEVSKDGKYNPIGRWYSEWFFKQVEKHLQNNKTAVDYIPLRDYYHRHSRSLFWELQDIVSFGNNVLFRYIFGWLMPPEIALLKLTQTDAITRLYDRLHVIQDLMLPIKYLEDSVKLYQEQLEIYPLWICPFRVYNNPGQLGIKSNAEYDMFIDVGVYGVPRAKGYETVKTMRNIESFLMKRQGFQMLCNDTYTTREEFRKMFDHTLYDKVRDTLPYCKEAFPEIYDKVKRSIRI